MVYFIITYYFTYMHYILLFSLYLIFYKILPRNILLLQLERNITIWPTCNMAISVSTKRLSQGFRQPEGVRLLLTSHLLPSSLSLGFSPYLPSSNFFLFIPLCLLSLLSRAEEKPK